jgi:hypothetical protein
LNAFGTAPNIVQHAAVSSERGARAGFEPLPIGRTGPQLADAQCIPERSIAMKRRKKIHLARETIRTLSLPALRDIAGGSEPPDSLVVTRCFDPESQACPSEKQPD